MQLLAATRGRVATLRLLLASPSRSWIGSACSSLLLLLCCLCHRPAVEDESKQSSLDGAGSPPPYSASQTALLVVLKECGFDLHAALQTARRTRQPIVINEPGSFQRQLERRLRTADKAMIESCETGVEEFLDDDAVSLLLLHPTVPPAAPAAGSMAAPSQRFVSQAPRADSYLQQSSVVRLLLLEQRLQPKLLEVLLDKFPSLESAKHKGEESASTVLRLLLSALRYLDTVHDSERLCRHLVQTMGLISDHDVLREVVMAVPEIIGATAQQDIVECLISLREREPRVTAAVLDTLMALSMDAQTKSEVVGSLLDGVAGQPVEDLPATVGFIVQAAGGSATEGKEAKSQLASTLERLRFALNHSGLSSYSSAISAAMRGHARRSAAAGGGASQRRGASAAAASGSAAPFMVLEALSQSFRHHPAVALGWLKAIQSSQDDVTDVDLWLLILSFATPVRSNTDHATKVVRAIKGKITSHKLSLDVAHRAVSDHPDVLSNLFRDLLRLADVLVRDGDASVRSVGATLQSSAFQAFPDQHDRNLIVDAFVTQISDAGAPDTANTALAELYKLVQSHPRAIAPYHNHLDALQEYLLHFTDSQLRCVMAIFAMLAVETREAGPEDDVAPGSRVLAVSNPFKILCRKQLSSGVYRFHRVGVFGSVAVLKQVGGIARTSVEGEMETGLRADNALQLFKQLCDELFDQLARVPASATRQADLFDELAAAIDCGSMHPEIVKLLLGHVVEQQCKSFIVDIGADAQLAPLIIDEESEDIQAAAWLNLSAGSTNAFSILPHVFDSKLRQTLPAMCPGFRLLGTCFRSLGNIDRIADLPNKPLLMYVKPSAHLFREELSEQHQHLLVSSTFHAICLLRELLSVFCAEPSMATEMSTRLRHLIQLQDLISTQCQQMGNKSFIPLGLPHEQSAREAEAAEKREAALRQKEEAASSKRAAAGNKKKKSSSKKPVEETDWLEFIRPLYRPLHFHVLRLLGLPLSLHADSLAKDQIDHAKAIKLGPQPAEKKAKAEINGESLRFLLRLLQEHIQRADECAHSPLASVHNQRVRSEHDDDDDDGDGQQHLVHSSEQMDMAELVRAIRPVLPHLGEHMRSVTRHLIAHPDGDDGVDGETFAPVEVAEESLQLLISVCQQLIDDKSLRLDDPHLHQSALAAFVRLTPFDEPEGSDADETAGAAAAGAAAAGATSFKTVCQRLYGLLCDALEPIKDLDEAVGVLRVLESLLSLAKSHKAAGALQWLEPRVSERALSLLLSDRWPSHTKFKLNTLGHAVRVMLKYSPDIPTACTNLMDPLEAILDGYGEDPDKDAAAPIVAEEYLDFLSTCQPTTAQWYVIPLLEQIAASAQQLSPTDYRDPREFFKDYSKYTSLFNRAIGIIRKMTISTPVFLSVMRFGRALLDNCKKHESAMDDMLRRSKQTHVLRDLQSIRRYLMDVCQYGKEHRVASLTTLVPTVKTSMEVFFHMFNSLCSRHSIRTKLQTVPSKTEEDAYDAEERVGVVSRRGKRRRRQEDEEDEEEEEEEEVEEEQEEEEEEEQAAATPRRHSSSSKRARVDSSSQSRRGAAAASSSSARRASPV